MHKLSLTFLVILGAAMVFTSCSKEETTNSLADNNNNLPAGPQDTITTFMVYFTNTLDSMTEIGSYDDPDGPGPKPANIGGVALKANSTYLITFFIEDATKASAPVYIHNKIKNNGAQYKICTSNPLGTTINPVDSDGIYPIGLINNMLTTGNTGNDNMNFTIKYQKDVKNGSCSPGVVYYSCNIPITIY